MCLSIYMHIYTYIYAYARVCVCVCMHSNYVVEHQTHYTLHVHEEHTLSASCTCLSRVLFSLPHSHSFSLTELPFSPDLFFCVCVCCLPVCLSVDLYASIRPWSLRYIKMFSYKNCTVYTVYIYIFSFLWHRRPKQIAVACLSEFYIYSMYVSFREQRDR